VRLESNPEIVDILRAVEEENNSCNLQFSRTIEIELPSTEISHEQLLSHVGERIGLLNMDGEFFYP
jgi:hypothetical protein